MTRAEHLAWCKQRALQCVDAGDLSGAASSFLSDVQKHPETKDIADTFAILGLSLLLSGCLSTPRKMRDHINGYN